MQKLWQIIDADPIAAAHPDTFQKPSREAISKVRNGDWVKLMFRQAQPKADDPGGERMWVAVEEVLPDGSFRGRLDNEPFFLRGIALDDPVSFQACHIIDIRRQKISNASAA